MRQMSPTADIEQLDGTCRFAMRYYGKDNEACAGEHAMGRRLAMKPQFKRPRPWLAVAALSVGFFMI
jgi:hypothetical protein